MINSKIILLAFSASFLIYLSGSFGFASFDISTWTSEGRNMISFLMVLGFIGSICFLNIFRKLEE